MNRRLPFVAALLGTVIVLLFNIRLVLQSFSIALPGFAAGRRTCRRRGRRGCEIQEGCGRVSTGCVLACVTVLAFAGAARADDLAAVQSPLPARSDWTADGLVDAFQHETKKDQYTLFNPTPPALMRELTTDRPDNTESPFTVDAGHLQTETTLFGYAHSGPQSSGSVSDSYEFGTTNVRIGLTNWSEISLIWQHYGIVQTHGSSLRSSMQQSGIGGLEIRTKIKG